MPSVSQNKVEILNPGEGGLGAINGLSRSNTAKLQSIFAASPIYAGVYDDADTVKEYLKVLKKEVNDGGHMFGIHNPDYSVESPNITSEVEASAGGDGGPGSPHLPNPMSPGPGSASPRKQPAPPEDMGERNVDVPGEGAGSALEPKTSSEAIFKQLFPVLELGKSTTSN